MARAMGTENRTVRARRSGKTGMVAVADAVTPELAAFLRQVFKPGRDPFDVIDDITEALDGQDNGNGKARNGSS